VTIFGRPSFGVLDYANVRLFILPSQQMFLFLPTTRSRRLPGGAIDNVGVVPDVRFDDDLASRKDSDAAVEYVRHYLERDLPTVNGSVPNGS
jgi:C-terminal processing protease CtpA/Prc